jgi:D-alanyl-D-alanine carboxypeptidase (penicillin-binding protein 5/6)
LLKIVSSGVLVVALGAAVMAQAPNGRPDSARSDARAVAAANSAPSQLQLPLPADLSPNSPEAAAAVAKAGGVGLDTPLPPPEVDAAPVAMLVDLSSGRTLYAREPAKPFLPASVTKVMTTFVAFDLMAQGKLDPNKLITVGDAAWQEWHAKGSRMFLARGSQLTVDQLLMGITTVSANDGCVVLAEGVAGSVPKWVAMMNADAKKLGMNDSHFGTPNGWMDNGNTYYSARDLVRLGSAIIERYPQYYHRYFGHETLTWNGITQRNHDPTIGVVPGSDGMKTGFTNEAHYTFLGSAQRDGRRLVMVLAAVPTAKERAKAAKALLEWGFDAWDAHQLFPAGATLGDAKVQQGTVDTIGLVTPRAYFATVPKGSSATVEARILYEGPLVAPIAKGEEVAQLELRIGNAAPVRLPLAAAAAVPEGGALDRLRFGLAGLLR